MLLFSRLKASQATNVAILAPNDATQAGHTAIRMGMQSTANSQNGAVSPTIGGLLTGEG